MKILHIVQSADTGIGGSLTVARALLKAQRALGMDAWLVCLYDSPERESSEAPAEFEIECLVTRATRWTKGVLTLRRLFHQLHPDIIHHHDGILWPRLAAFGLGIPRVTHGHLGAPTSDWFSGARFTHRFTLATTSRLIAISPWVARSWEDSGMPHDRIALIPNGVDTGRFYRRTDAERAKVRAKLGVDPKDRVVLWVGRLDRETKGLDRLVMIASKLSESTRLVIGGDGPDRAWLEAALKNTGIKRHPLLVGRLDDPSELFGSADAFLFTSVVEPFGLVLLEAACSGLPIYACVCTGGGRELLNELKAFVAPDDALHLLAEAVSRDELRLPEEQIKTTKERYSWGKLARATSQVYVDCLRQPLSKLNTR